MSDIVTKLDNTEEPLLRLEDLSIDYRIRNGYLSAVSDVNFTMNRGEIVALVGESGCGKSTIAFTIMRLLMDGNEKIGGKILFKGEDLNKIPVRDMEKMRGKHIGMIFQNPLDSLNPVYRTGSQVEEAILLDGLSHKEAWERVINLYKDVRIPDAEKRVNSYPHQLSGGQLQRIAIARALVLRPDIMVLDEPTSALDISVQAQILNLLLDLQEQFGLTYLIITHDLNVLRYISDRIAVMYLGKLMEFGPTETISSNPLHPYTHGLMAASPILDPTLRSQKKELMGGETGSLINLPKGCRFAARCPHATDRCREELPKDYHVDALHQVSCFLYDK